MASVSAAVSFWPSTCFRRWRSAPVTAWYAEHDSEGRGLLRRTGDDAGGDPYRVTDDRDGSLLELAHERGRRPVVGCQRLADTQAAARERGAGTARLDEGDTKPERGDLLVFRP
ncbi:hypothetical protein [Streptomyces tauricus]|uniref:hypothetical protein n=1 Tax=Streptomyces tauricus TaxID=68274 RepID=UPI0033ADC706